MESTYLGADDFTCELCHDSADDSVLKLYLLPYNDFYKQVIGDESQHRLAATVLRSYATHGDRIDVIGLWQLYDPETIKLLPFKNYYSISWISYRANLDDPPDLRAISEKWLPIVGHKCNVPHEAKVWMYQKILANQILQFENKESSIEFRHYYQFLKTKLVEEWHRLDIKNGETPFKYSKRIEDFGPGGSEMVVDIVDSFSLNEPFEMAVPFGFINFYDRFQFPVGQAGRGRRGRKKDLERQLKRYECIKNGMSYEEVARLEGVSMDAIRKSIDGLRKKGKK